MTSSWIGAGDYSGRGNHGGCGYQATYRKLQETKIAEVKNSQLIEQFSSEGPKQCTLAMHGVLQTYVTLVRSTRYSLV